MAANQCNYFNEAAFNTRGFFGAPCGTFFGGFSNNCKSQQQAAQVMTTECRNNLGIDAANQRTTATLLTVLKWAAIGFILFYALKWYLK